MADRGGQRVRITAGFPEMVRKTGVIRHREGQMYRVRLDEQVYVPGVGVVRDDLWESKYLLTLRDRKNPRRMG